MKRGSRHFFIILAAMTALCCAVIVLYNFKGMPPFENTADFTSSGVSSAWSSAVSLESSGTASSAAAISSAGASQVSSALVNLNTADEAALASLPGIGDTLAQRIIDYRNAHGPFTSVNQLDNVKGIGEKKLASLKGLVTV